MSKYPECVYTGFPGEIDGWTDYAYTVFNKKTNELDDTVYFDSYESAKDFITNYLDNDFNTFEVVIVKC